MSFTVEFVASQPHIGTSPSMTELGLPFRSLDAARDAARIIGANDLDMFVVKEGGRIVHSSPAYARHIERSLRSKGAPLWRDAMIKRAEQNLAPLTFAFAGHSVSYSVEQRSERSRTWWDGRFIVSGDGIRRGARLRDYVTSSGARQYRSFDRDFTGASLAWSSVEHRRRPAPGHHRLLDQILEAEQRLTDEIAAIESYDCGSEEFRLWMPELRLFKQFAVQMTYGAEAAASLHNGYRPALEEILAGEREERHVSFSSLVASVRPAGIDRASAESVMAAEYGDVATLARAAVSERLGHDHRGPGSFFPTLSSHQGWTLAYAVSAGPGLPSFAWAKYAFDETVARRLGELLDTEYYEVWQKGGRHTLERAYRPAALEQLLAEQALLPGSRGWRLKEYEAVAATVATHPLDAGRCLVADMVEATIVGDITPPEPRFRVRDACGNFHAAKITPYCFVNASGALLRRRFAEEYARLLGPDSGPLLDWMIAFGDETSQRLKRIARVVPMETAVEALSRALAPLGLFLSKLGEKGYDGHCPGCNNDLALTERVLAAAGDDGRLRAAAEGLGCDCRAAGLYREEKHATTTVRVNE